MTQEFRVFTQRLTDESNETTRIFNVRAKTIVDRFGNDVIDAKGNKIWFPENFDPAGAIAFGKSLASDPTLKSAVALYRNVRQGGPWDLQRSYNGQSSALFASVFTNAASYAYGLIGAAAGFSTTTLMAAAGAYNAVMNPKTAGPTFGNNPNNPPFISKGIRDFFDSSYGPPAIIPGNSLQGSPAFIRQADRFRTTSDRPLKGASDDVNRLAASAATGDITPSVGFTDPTNAHPFAGSFPQGLDSVTSFSGRDGWLSSMLRNGEVERFMPDKTTAPPPVSGSPDNTAVFGDRFGRWGSSPAGIAAPPASDAPASFDHRFGTWNTVPAGGLGGIRWPVLRELEKYRRSAAPDGPGPTSVRGAVTPATQCIRPLVASLGIFRTVRPMQRHLAISVQPGMSPLASLVGSLEIARWTRQRQRRRCAASARQIFRANKPTISIHRRMRWAGRGVPCIRSCGGSALLFRSHAA